MLNNSESIGCYVRSDGLFARLQTLLQQSGFGCERFASENSLSRMLSRRGFTLLLIDIGNHRDDSEDFVSWLNCRTGNSTPVIALSQGTPEMAALALNAGADDFIGAHFEAVEAIARIRAVIRRHRPNSVRRTIALGKFTLDREAASAAYDGETVELTPREFTMAWLFFSSPGVFISRGTIGASIWSADSEVAGRTIEQHVYKLRKKLQFGVERGVIIRTSYSQGYRLEYTPPA
ncbi:response regulator transcription factor [Massilia antarctica]|uniref:Response regulator transcription factor n=1 Tax=Massilia antarctica TaxID=2765360 RepID=A0AA48WAB6_9BURK|nr:response regulator transcription factor [Massilia antarctica]QPI47635.1 response regulator transcription factor [Massilia antarctica]